jgi:ATP-dependent RNA helicase DeaD
MSENSNQDPIDIPARKPEPQLPQPPRETRFDDFPLTNEVQQAVQKTGYENPTPVQAEIIPHMLDGRDVLAQSQTGTGKTAAFALPILSRIDTRQRAPQVLVLTPTRELAIQVAKSFSTYGVCLPGFSVAAIYGGQDYEPQLKQLRRGVNVVVGTPGRVIDHIKRGTLDLGNIKCLVLDEADEMLNMGFLEDVQFVLEETPDTRQTALFSATIPEPIRDIAKRYLKDPVKVTIKRKTMTADSIRQRAVFVSPRDKIDVLTRFLEVEETDGVLVFTRTKDSTSMVAEKLVRAGLAAFALNGDMAQKSRERTIERLKAGQIDIVVATDVAARGLDVTRVSHVFNFDLPEGSDSYIHRVGRTGRAGRAGEAIIFLTNSQRSKLRYIERATRQPIEIVQPPTADQINAMRIKKFKTRITKTIDKRDLSQFVDMIRQHAEQSGQPMEMIAAAVAHIGQNGRPFLKNDRPAEKYRDGDRGSRERNTRGSKRDRHLGPPEEGMCRYRISVGHRDGVRPGNIVGAVANEAGIDGEFIGPIKIHESYSTIDLPADMPHDVCEKLRNAWVAGRQMQLAVASDEDRQSTRPKRNNGRPNEKQRANKSRRSKVRGSERSAAGKFSFAARRKKRKIKA